MFSNSRKSPRIEELTSVEEDTLGSSISLSLGENSIRIKEKHKPAKESEPPVEEQNVTEKWWLKKPETCLELPTPILIDAKIKQSPSPSPDVSSSMKEFLEKEKMCKALHKSELEQKDKDDTLCDILASAAFDKYPSDFENATDDDIGSILEEMSKIAGAFSPNSAPERSKSQNSNKNPTEEERSVEELLEEAEKLVRKNSSSLSKSASKSDTLVPENLPSDDTDSLGRVRQLEADIFQMIEEEMHKESEKIKKSPKNERVRGNSPGFESVYENLVGLKPPKSLELQRKKFEEQKVEVSSSSDLDDPIERHSKSEELKSARKMEMNKDNLQKEIIDVDKDFFEDLMKKSKDKTEGGMSGSSSFGQEDFSHFLKILQSQSDKKDQELNETNNTSNFLFKVTGTVHDEQEQASKSPEFPEKEITEILEKELPDTNDSKLQHKTIEPDFSGKKDHFKSDKSKKSDETMTKIVSKDPQKAGKKEEISAKIADATSSKKVVNSKHELYTVGLTPRLELFADAIPKLLAEKSTQDTIQQNKEKEVEVTKLNRRKTIETKPGSHPPQATSNNNNEPTGRNNQKPVIDVNKVNRAGSGTSDIKQRKKELKFCKSKSYDQICKPPFRTSLESIKSVKMFDFSKKALNAHPANSTLKSKLQPKPAPKVVPKTKTPLKPKREPVKAGSTSTLSSIGKTLSGKSPDSQTRNAMAGGDTKQNVTKQNWEILCREERQRNALLKQRLDSEMKQYKSQVDNIRMSFEEELFVLKKENIILKARVDELSLSEKRVEYPKRDAKIGLLEKELEKQENLIRAYETENKKLIQEAKRMQEEMKNLQRQKSTALESNKTQQLLDRVKDLEEQVLKLNLEASDLKQKNSDCMLKNDDLQQQNSLLNDELEMFKEQLQAKNDFIIDKLQAMTSAELELKKQAEDMSVKLSSKTEQLRVLKLEYEKIQQNVLPMEKELLELRVKEGTLQDKLQVAKSHVEREKQLTQKLKDQVILDNKKIMDLNRQVREMERILKRKNPDSVSALILTANSEQEKIGIEKVKLLEARIASLEKEIKAKDELAQQKVTEFQKKFTEVKEKYRTQITELEEKLLEAEVKNRKVCNDMFTQTTSINVESRGVETVKKEEKPMTLEKEEKKEQKTAKPQLKSQNSKEDTHLVATIRGLKFELANKDKAVSKLTKEYQELQKTNRRLQKEREKLLNDRRTIRTMDLEKTSHRMVSSDSKLLTLKSVEGNDQNSNVYQNGHVSDPSSQRLFGSTQKLYDPMQYTENSESNVVKRLTDENEILKEELSKMNKDFMALKNKRLHDLNLLQEEHEREMATLLKEYSVKFGESKVVKLQGQINTQVAVITHLKQQIEKLRDYKEQVVVLKAEREHLENKVKTLNEKVKYLSTPGTEQLQLLQDKITILQQRHESREMTLQTLVRDLLRNRTQCKDCKNEKGKNRQLCYFRQELDHILGMLQEITNVH